MVLRCGSRSDLWWSYFLGDMNSFSSDGHVLLSYYAGLPTVQGGIYRGMASHVHSAWHPNNLNRGVNYHSDARQSDVREVALGRRESCRDTARCSKPDRYTEHAFQMVAFEGVSV